VLQLRQAPASQLRPEIRFGSSRHGIFDGQSGTGASSPSPCLYLCYLSFRPYSIVMSSGLVQLVRFRQQCQRTRLTPFLQLRMIRMGFENKVAIQSLLLHRERYLLSDCSDLKIKIRIGSSIFFYDLSQLLLSVGVYWLNRPVNLLSYFLSRWWNQFVWYSRIWLEFQVNSVL
jgi:hypothetical protein